MYSEVAYASCVYLLKAGRRATLKRGVGITADRVAKRGMSILLGFLRRRTNPRGASERSDTGWKPMLL
jgi:hypothetical protein